MKKKFTMLFAALLACVGVMAEVTLPDANKSYTVVAEGHNSGAKPGWAINNEKTAMVSFGNTAIADEAQKEFAFVQNNGKVYLYSVWAKKFVNKSMSLTDALPIDPITVENVDGGKYFFKYDDSHIMNIGGSKQLAPDTWSTKDGGNQYTLTIVQEEIDLTAALAILNNSAKVTYQYVYGEEVKFEETIETVPGGEYPDYNMTFPFGVVAAAKPEGQVSNDETVQIELSIKLPFAYAESYAAVENNQSWYYLLFHATGRNYLYYDGTENVLDASKTSFDKNNKDAYSWAFVGNPFDGFKLVNRLAGADKRLNASKDGAVVSTADHTFVLTSSTYGTNGFFMASTNGENTQRFNKQGGKVVYWSGADAGSTFMVEIRPMGPVAELEALIGEAETLLATVNANLGTAIGEYAQATADALGAAITAAKAIEEANATAENVATLQAAMDAVKVILPTAGQYYQIHSSLTKFATEQGEGVVKAVYSNNGTPSWKTLNGDDKSFYWLAVDAGNGNVVFQNAADKKYLVGNAGQSGAWEMADAPTAASNISVKIFDKENANGYEYGVIMNNWQMHCAGHGEGKNASGTIVSWNTDAANSASSWYIVEVELKEFCDITYNFVYGEDVKYSTTVSVAKDAAYPAVVVPTLPYGVIATATTPEGTVTEAKTFDFALTVEHELPFEAADDVKNIKTWYYAQMHANSTVTSYIEDVDAENIEWQDKFVEETEIDSHLWGFAGDIWNGIKVVNKATGRAIVSTSGSAVLGDAANATAFIPTYSNGAFSEWFCLKYPESNYLNASGDQSKGEGKINSYGNADNGSSFFLTEYNKEYTVTVGESGFSTYYTPQYKLAIPETVEAYVVSSVEGEVAILEQVTGVLSANTAIILKGKGEYAFVTSAAATTTIEKNLLKGTATETEIEGPAYILTAGANGVGLYKAELSEEGKFTNKANEAYLKVEDSEVGYYALEMTPTGIANVEILESTVIYDLLGRRVEKMEKGLYIVNGKKVLVK